jgi:predicted TPR repeat methyltransferase
MTPDEALALAKKLARKGDIPAAISLYQGLLERNPRNKKAKKELKALQQQRGATTSAASMEDQFREMLALHAGGDHQPCLILAKRLSRIYPDQPLPHNIMGSIHASRGPGEAKAALKCFNRAVELEPAYTDAHLNRAAILRGLGQLEEAGNAYRRIIQLHPGDAEAHYLLGVNLADLGEYEQALASFDSALQLEPDRVAASAKAGDALKSLGRYPEAIARYLQAIELKPEDAPLRLKLAITQVLAGQRDAATASFERCLELDPATDEARHLLAANLQQRPDSPPPGYVERLFDDYAPKFEQHIVDVLGYGGPAILAQLLAGSSEGSRRFGRAIDLGCGTGLAGELFKKRCDFLAGVDLSDKMLERARAKNLYDELICGDLVTSLEQAGDNFDLLISADVFIYVGELSPLAAAIGQRAAPGSLLLFSTEHCDGEEFELRDSGRFAHSRPYILQTFERQGFELLDDAIRELRKEQKEWLSGGYYLFRRGA